MNFDIKPNIRLLPTTTPSNFGVTVTPVGNAAKARPSAGSSPVLYNGTPPNSPRVLPNAKPPSGIPTVAAASKYTAPVHIDVGGTIYTSSLETLTKNPESRLAKMFNGTIPIVLDSLKQHYFIDRDGPMFRHILNFLRKSKLCLPEGFQEIDMLLEEANFYEISAMVKQLETYKNLHLSSQSQQLTSTRRSEPESSSSQKSSSCKTNDLAKSLLCSPGDDLDCLALNICPDLGERVMLSGERSIIDEAFPEVSEALLDIRQNVAWNADPRNVVRFPLNGYCKITSVEAIKRLLKVGYQILASTGGGVEGQQFSEYLFCRKQKPC
ncbi:unnamed protein product [Cyprideis torosa]|uniref:Uncharacterized protein n=1 Tax=Cyprideis torosa TaxID=163714 RepID=A0A7R8W0Z7_9CRUS|nr:unnamed protein product [Cyprideis torosa]CAG0880161.1 unnamed protein product [Cyprideis torosa]